MDTILIVVFLVCIAAVIAAVIFDWASDDRRDEE